MDKALFAGAVAGLTAVLAHRKTTSAATSSTSTTAASASDALSPRARLRTTTKSATSWAAPSTLAGMTSVFTVTTANGFLPLVPPLRTLPAAYAALEAVMSQLPKLLHDAAPDALAAAVARIPQYTIPADASPLLLQALMRDYSMLVSAYLLEGKTKSDKPRSSVPANISVPFVDVSKRVDEQTIMSYDSYCLTNCVSERLPAVDSDALLAKPLASLTPATYDPASGAHDWDAMRLIRSFDGGPEEWTFITVHAEIESHTPDLIASFATIITGVAESDLPAVKRGLANLKTVLDRIIVAQIKMFNASDPRNYEKYVRPWIFGWRGNADFDSGVTFEGTGGGPTFLRGETGAQSSIIPSIDIVLGITHKSDALRAMLAELEAYRPKPQRDFLAYLRRLMWGEDTGVGLAPETRGERTPSTGAVPATSSYSAKVALHSGAKDGFVGGPAAVAEDVSAPHALRDFVRSSGDREAVTLFNACVGNVWAFRDIHVTFSALYIGRYTSKETATGGTPYKAYLRKHRDESIAHQIADFGGDYMARFRIPTPEEFEAELSTVLQDATVNGIPPHLMARHATIIARHGRDAASLSHKTFPGGAEWRGTSAAAAPAVAATGGAGAGAGAAAVAAHT